MEYASATSVITTNDNDKNDHRNAAITNDTIGKQQAESPEMTSPHEKQKQSGMVGQDHGDNYNNNVIDHSVGDNDNDDGKSYTLIAKYGKEKITLDDLSGEMTIGEVKEIIHSETRILPKRQKLVGLVAIEGGAKGVTDDCLLSELKVKPIKGISSGSSNKKDENATASNMEVIIHQFILMGTPEEEIFIDPGERDDLPDVIDDFDLDFNAGSEEWINHVTNGENLKKFTEKTPVHIMNPPRPGKPLLVLDLDHTLLDFSSKTLQQDSVRQPGQGLAAIMKRPYMDEFLCTCYQYYDMIVWSQTSWRWLETKLIELGMVTHPQYKFCFVLDKTSMFTITSTRKGMSVTHHVKPLQIIWSKFNDRWGCHNTIHIDDLSRNFALNLKSGLKIKPYYRKKASARRDIELLGLSHYLQQLAQANINFEKVDFTKWTDVAAGKTPLIEEIDNDDGVNDNNNNKNDKKK